jgi:hypothetical protein
MSSFVMVTPRQRQRRRETHSLPPWASPPYREIESKIGEGLRQRYQPPEELPHRLQALLMQIKRQDEDK